LDVDQLNLGMRKDIAMRKTGIILTLTGLGIFTAGGITSIIMAANPPDDPNEDPWYKLKRFGSRCTRWSGWSFLYCSWPPVKGNWGEKNKCEAMLLLRKLECCRETPWLLDW
jgi:hypothetical protein